MIDYQFYTTRYAEFGKRLAQERKRAGLTQQGLADKIEAELGKAPGQNTLSNWENGKAFPDSIEVIFAMSRILGCDCGYLFCDYEERTHNATDICKATGLSEETINTLCTLKAWQGDTALTAVIDALVYDFRYATKGENIAPLAYLISWFLRYSGDSSNSMRIYSDGRFRDCSGATGYTADTLKLNSRIIENAALTEIQQGLVSLKKRISRKERRNNG